VRLCRQACSSSESYGRVPSLLTELSVAACQLHAATSFSSPSPSSSASRPLLTPSALIPLAASCVGALLMLHELRASTLHRLHSLPDIDGRPFFIFNIRVVCQTRNPATAFPLAGACVALTALLLKRTRSAGSHSAAAVGGATGEAGDAAGAAVSPRVISLHGLV